MKRANSFQSLAILFALPLAMHVSQNTSCRSGSTNTGNSSMNANTSVVTRTQDLRGTWGGQSISMEVTAEGAEIEFDCAHGRITEEIAPDGDGKFEVKGTFARERGGPQRMGENNDQPAVYRGSIKEKTMTLRIELTRNNQDLGTFTLTQGSTGKIHKCSVNHRKALADATAKRGGPMETSGPPRWFRVRPSVATRRLLAERYCYCDGRERVISRRISTPNRDCVDPAGAAA